ncbi:Toll6p [Dermatophagoides pteronyssinus]|uniref:Toll6p n=1 Tax=Dermatophagoides pteronyssinus TaxID=6956 RepID=A0ABQ8J2I6_DERPT|nr:Toll6p [Dermatophagoides pteronyssinus]
MKNQQQSINQPFEHLHSLQSLQIDDCLFDRIPSDIFRGLLSLKNLTIRRSSTNIIQKNDNNGDQSTLNIDDDLIIEQYSFRHIESTVEHLDLSKNGIKSLPNDLFCPFLTLHTLNLSNNFLNNLVSFGLIDPATGRLCLQELYHLDLSNNHLEFVPETSGVAALKNLQYLNLSSNHITEITELAFSALRRLHVLDLSGNRLRTLPGRMFRDSDELRELHLANNGLIELPVGLFQGLSKLQILNIADNQITSDTLTPETFADLIRVIKLNLSGNNLHRLPASIFQNQYSLQILSLENNQLEIIDEGSFSTLYNLQQLILSGNRFRHLPESILSGLFVLQHLSLSNNQLEHIHEDAFKNCSNLQNLDLSSNRLTTIPMAIRSLNKLYQLNLGGNKFTTWTDSTALINTKIKKFDLSDNYLVNISRNALRPLSKTLQQLYLGGNRLRSLDKDIFIDLQKTLRLLRLEHRLQIFNISYNKIKHFDYSIIPNNLIILDISGNRLDKLSNQDYEQQQLRLEQLNVNENQLKEITAISIPNSIRILNIRQNRLEKIDQFAFVAKHNITFVDLRNNSLRRIDNNAFRLGVQRPTTGYYQSADYRSALSISSIDLEQIEDNDNGKNLPAPIFLISGNPYFCDCTMEWLQRVNQLVGGVTGSGQISTYPKIGDLDHVECELAFSRQSLANNRSISTSAATISNESTTATAKSKSSNNHRIPLLLANSSNFLCRYRSHCFALCHCCEFDACDCEMMCPENCTCYYDQTWNTNIVDCSGGHYQQVPLRIPMDVTSLYLDGNHLQILNPHTFIGRKNLRILHLNHSSIEQISNRSFNGLVYLEELYLENNLLTALYGYEFESLHYLTILNLQNNRLSFINDKTFYQLRSLQSLRIDHNHLQTFGQWFAIEPTSLTIQSSVNQNHHIHHHNHHHHQNILSLRLGDNPWSCQCQSLSIMYEILWQLRQHISVIDYQQIRCQPNGSTLFVGGSSANHLIDKCNLTRQYYLMLNTPTSTTTNGGLLNPLIEQSSSSSSSPIQHQDYYPATVRPPTPAPSPSLHQSTSSSSYPQNANNFDSIYHHQSRPINNNNQNNNNNDDDDDNDPDLTYQPIDLLGGLRPKLLPPSPPQLPPSIQNQSYWPSGSHFSIPSSSSTTTSMTFNSSSWFWMIFIPSILLILSMTLFLTIRFKQDIQLWFYGHYGIRLFESGFCFGSNDNSSSNSGSGSGSIGSTSRSRKRNGRNGNNGSGFNDNYVRDSEKLFDAFVIYARQDESFVAQQLAAELECGYPPYRLCLRYRDLPAPPPPTTTATNLDSLTTTSSSSPISNGIMSTKDHGYAFDAVTQAIECSRRTLVVISEQFLQSEWCKFELKAAHQETLTSCKTHRLIVVVVPTQQQQQQQQPLVSSPMTSPTLSTQIQMNNNNNNNTPAKQAESLLQRLDTETKTCIRGVTILTWQERRFWEKLRFAMPANSTVGINHTGNVNNTTSGGLSSSLGVIGSMSGALGSLTFGNNNNTMISNIGRNHHHHHQHHGPVVVDNLKGRTSTVVVTTNNCGYPTLQPSSLSSSSSLARSSILYDTTTLNNHHQQQQQQIYQHHYHYAQLPSTTTTNQSDRSTINQSTMSLHKLGKNNNNNNTFQTKPLPPPPNQPLPPLPSSLINNNNNSVIQSPLLHSNHHHQQQQQQAPPPYVEYTNQQQQMIIESNPDCTNQQQTMLNLHGRRPQQSSYYLTQQQQRTRAPL